VRRLDEGATVVLFDGRGHEVDARLEAIEGRWFAVRQGATREGRTDAQATLGWAIPKGARLDAVTRQTTELGVGSLLLLETEQGVVRLGSDRVETRIARPRRVAAEAARQCGRADVLTVDGPVSLTTPLGSTANAQKVMLSPKGGALLEPAALRGPAAVFLGPEGGFTPKEVTLAEAAGAQRFTLNSPVLRTETAAVVGCALVLHRQGAL
jgi:16S rRNA (uracil1498-N3)-methyltransferase